MNGFEHENLDVYRVSIEFLVLADELAASLPKGRAYLADQLRRASTSISLNIAEGAGEFSKSEKARFYRIARRSGTECAAILDGCRALQLADEQYLSHGRELLVRIVAMLTSMVLRLKKKRSGSRVAPPVAQGGSHRSERAEFPHSALRAVFRYEEYRAAIHGSGSGSRPSNS